MLLHCFVRIPAHAHVSKRTRPCHPTRLSHPLPPPPTPAAAYVKWGSADRQNFTEEEANQPLGLEIWLRSLLPSADADSSSGGSSGGSSPVDAAGANGAGAAGEEGASSADARGKRKNE